jgi:hypothetical protein
VIPQPGAYALVVDPGVRPGVVVLDVHGTLLAATHTTQDPDWWGGWGPSPPARLWPLAVTEDQWLHPAARGKKAASPASLFKLARRSGWQLSRVTAKRYMVIPPSAWRGGSGVDKVQMQNRIASTLTPAERKLFSDIPKARHGDVLDAIGIGRHALFVAESTTKYDWTP